MRSIIAEYSLRVEFSETQDALKLKLHMWETLYKTDRESDVWNL